MKIFWHPDPFSGPWQPHIVGFVQLPPLARAGSSEHMSVACIRSIELCACASHPASCVLAVRTLFRTHCCCRCCSGALLLGLVVALVIRTDMCLDLCAECVLFGTAL